MWLGTNRGIAIFDPTTKQINCYRDLGSIEQNTINCLARSGDTILAGTQNGLIVIDTRGTASIDDDVVMARILPSQVSCQVFAIGVHNDFWISACPGLIRLNRNLQNYNIILHPFGDSVKAMLVVNDTLHIATEQGIARFNGTGFEMVVLFPERYTIFDLAYYDNKFYVATRNGLLQYNGNNLSFIFNEDTRSILFSNGLWLGVGGYVYLGGGLQLQQNNSWQEFKNNGLAMNIVSSAISDREGNIYAMHYPVGNQIISLKKSNNNWQILLDSIANSYIAVIDNDNYIWFGHWILNGGLTRYDPINDSWLVKSWSGLKGVVGALGIDNNQVKWFHNQANTLIALTDDSVYEFTIPGLSRPEKHGYELVFDRENTGWLGWSGGLLRIKYNDNNLSDIVSKIYSYLEIMSLTVDLNNRVWCATNQGAVILEKDTFRTYNTTNSQILNDKVVRIKSDKWGRVWMLHPQGLSSYDIFSNRWSHYTASNCGIIANEDNDEKFYQWLYVDEENGFLLIATKEGISQYNFQITSTTTLNRVRIYPNPFSKTIHSVITFDSLPQSAKIKIFDLQGNYICELLTNPIYCGVRWRPINIATGIYLALVTTPKEKLILKFAVVN